MKNHVEQIHSHRQWLGILTQCVLTSQVWIRFLDDLVQSAKWTQCKWPLKMYIYLLIQFTFYSRFLFFSLGCPLCIEAAHLSSLLPPAPAHQDHTNTFFLSYGVLEENTVKTISNNCVFSCFNWMTWSVWNLTKGNTLSVFWISKTLCYMMRLKLILIILLHLDFFQTFFRHLKNL